MKRIIAILCILSLAVFCSHQHYTYLRAAEERENPSPEKRAHYSVATWRMERMDRDALPSGFRSCLSEMKEREPIPGYDPSYVPSRKGLDNLKASASSDFSSKELDSLVKEIRKYHDGPITVVDLRKETHGLLNGNHLSLNGEHNWANLGLGRNEIINKEREIIHGTIGQRIDVKARNIDGINVVTAETEEEACAKRGIGYFRLTVLDHCFSDPESIDSFIAFVKDLPENTWLHFHCLAGMGRTNMYLVFYDFLRNPDVSEKDIIYRQYKLGGNFMYYKGDKENEQEYKVPLAQEKAEMIPLVLRYIKENQPKGFKVSWTEWKKHQRG